MTLAPVSDEAALLARALVLFSVAEVQSGHATRIDVTADGDRFAVADNGRGHSIDKQVEGTPYLSFIYEHFDFPFGRASPGPVQLQGIGLSLVNQLCAELRVTVSRSDTQLVLAFQAGTLASQDRRSAAKGLSGVHISGRVRHATAATPLASERLSRWLSALLAATPGLVLTYNGQPVHAPQGGG